MAGKHPVPAELEGRAHRVALQACRDAHAPDGFYSRIEIVWSGRMTRALGSANYETWTIKLSSQMMPKIAQSEFDDTVRHEVAHLLAYARYGTKAWNHGELWQRVARECGAKPSSRTDEESVRVVYKSLRRKQVRVVCKCLCTKAVPDSKRRADGTWLLSQGLVTRRTRKRPGLDSVGICPNCRGHVRPTDKKVKV